LISFAKLCPGEVVEGRRQDVSHQPDTSSKPLDRASENPIRAILLQAKQTLAALLSKPGELG
jgi:hypothetical protein